VLGLDALRKDARVEALATFLQLSLERVLGAVAGFREIGIGTVHQGVGVTVRKLVFHGVITALAAFVWFLRTLPAVGIIEKMIAGAFRHGKPFEVCALTNNDYRVRLRRKLAAGNIRRCGGLYLQVIVMIRIGKFNTQLT
jgi:hypothetical protein